MSDALYVRYEHTRIAGQDGYKAEVILNGEPASFGFCPNVHPYSTEGITRKSAIALAITRFSAGIGKDVRDASEAAQ